MSNLSNLVSKALKGQLLPSTWADGSPIKLGEEPRVGRVRCPHGREITPPCVDLSPALAALDSADRQQAAALRGRYAREKRERAAALRAVTAQVSAALVERLKAAMTLTQQLWAQCTRPLAARLWHRLGQARVAVTRAWAQSARICADLRARAGQAWDEVQCLASVAQ